jgi:hypothetical protein
LGAAAIGGGVAAALFGIYADLAYNAYSATNSSPQTTELFASDRTDTLWKYVKLGGVQVVAIGVFGTVVSRSLWPLLGVLVVGAVMTGLYAHAVKAGGGTPKSTLALVS